MKVLITGGAGFIGSHLAQRLLENGDEITVIDDLSTGNLSNICDFADHKNFKFIEGDVRNIGLVEELVEDIDQIYHLAAAVGVRLIAEKPVHTIETNIHGTEVVLDAANKFNRKVFLASTSEVYGKNNAVPLSEDDDIVLGSTSQPRWSYACSKAIDEFLGLAFYDQYKLSVVIGRFFNTIGPRQSGDYGMVVPRFVQKALKNEPLEIYGSGKQSRCFCYVQDVLDAMIALMNTESAAGKVYNIGTTEEITVEHLADKIIEMTAAKSEKRFISYDQAYGRKMEDMMRRLPCIDRIRDAVGWQPKYSLDKALAAIIKSHKMQMA